MVKRIGGIYREGPACASVNQRYLIGFLRVVVGFWAILDVLKGVDSMFDLAIAIIVERRENGGEGDVVRARARHGRPLAKADGRGEQVSSQVPAHGSFIEVVDGKR